jgi:MFS transporter, FLVCR family, MFS-domain-containing protein 7
VVAHTAQGALRAGPNASPPLNMHKAIIFNGVFIAVPCMLVFFLRGKQARKEMDESKIREQVSERGDMLLGERSR